MAGLLKQLQRSRPRTAESQPVVVTAEDAVVDVIPATAAVRGTEQIDRRYVEAEKLLGDLMKESKGTPDGAVPATPPTEAGSKALHIIRRSAESASGAAVKQVASQTGAPSWSREERKLPEHTERFLLDACRTLIEKVSQGIPPRNELPQFVQTMVEELASQRVGDVRLSWKDNDMVLREIAALYLTRGPMTPLFEDNDVTEIFVDHHKSIKVIRKGQLIDTPFQFSSSEEYRLSVMFLLDEAGWQLSSSKPIVECVLADKWQSRVSVLDGSLMGAAEPRLTIRIPRSMKTSFYEILQRKVLPATLAAWLAEVVARGEANILIVGQSG
ncbi:MAG: hypothetical protein IT290_06440, partial [Deltaproteobacteria bacterium]|nr:hypothetical protein [Deltaproteobacteria bacterium]